MFQTSTYKYIASTTFVVTADKGKGKGGPGYIPVVTLPVDTPALYAVRSSITVPETQFFPFLRSTDSKKKEEFLPGKHNLGQPNVKVLVSNVEPPSKYQQETFKPSIPVQVTRKFTEPLQPVEKESFPALQPVEEEPKKRQQSAPAFNPPPSPVIQEKRWNGLGQRSGTTPISSQQWQSEFGPQIVGSTGGAYSSGNREAISNEAYQQLLRGEIPDNMSVGGPICEENQFLRCNEQGESCRCE